ncbi:MAG: 4-hydroxythreonine-4-phosphate dehydrogenase PdxA, partial [Alphaproteobacteria bacterium]
CEPVLAAIRLGVKLTQAGSVSALVTNPIEKAVLYEAGFRHPGHTEFLAELTCAAAPPVMLLTCPASGKAPGLRVALATVHLPLAQVAPNLSRGRIIATAQAAARALIQDFGVAAPRLAVAALNPHGGEQGALGREEIAIIAPAVADLRAAGIDCHGPFPADTLFHAEARRKYDCVICMYHDQALIPLKTIDFARGVNVTLGLDIVRTSPDHGVALDIAGKGIASPASLIAALQMARDIARCRYGA